jgi:hypothetical protein
MQQRRCLQTTATTVPSTITPFTVTAKPNLERLKSIDNLGTNANCAITRSCVDPSKAPRATEDLSINNQEKHLFLTRLDDQNHVLISLERTSNI